MTTRLLESIKSPADLRKLPVEKLTWVATELRDFLIDKVSATGGHLAPSLGTVELTLALHYVYNTPTDKLIWDVGHQAYVHKILTGRRDQFHTLRQFGGISGFPRITESPYDALSVGHASTSISAALGMACARDILKERHAVVAVIGDGSLSGGLALEGLNNVGSSATGITIVLNDNEMSISHNVGALSRYLTRVLTDKRYTKIKTEIWSRLGGSNVGKSIRSIVKGIDDAVKHAVIPGKLFEDMGLRYLGPVNGHNISEMIDVFRSVKEQPDLPQLVHIITKKGKGYRFAENDATKYHGIGSFSPDTGDLIKAAKAAPPSYSEVFGTTLVELAHTRPQIVAVTAAMPDGTKLSQFGKAFPNRFFDVGIAEGHAVTFAAGLALKGLCPVVALYSTFLQRAYDHIMHDVALDQLHVVFCIDRAGLVGDDGPTHHGMFDLSFLRTVPGAVIMAPRNEIELRNMLFTAIDTCTGPVFIRYPRGATPNIVKKTNFSTIPIGIPHVIRKGSTIALLPIGNYFELAEQTCELLIEHGFNPTLVDARFAKPLDRTFYANLFNEHQLIVTFENNSLAGGFGSGIMELVHTMELSKPPQILPIGLPDAFVTHGEVNILLKTLDINPESIVKKIVAKPALHELLPNP